MKKYIFLLSLLFPMVAKCDIYIIANKSLSISELSKTEVAAIYLLKKQHWDDGEIVVPINLPAQSVARNYFTDKVLESSTDKLSSYWDKMSFRGINPPMTQNSEQAVYLFVERVKGAIGYVETKPNNDNIKIVHKITEK